MSLDHLNHAQRQAVLQRDAHLLIIAGPGTGKTQTLIERISSLVPEIKSNQKILAITFTNKAAKEMRQRIESRGAFPKDRLFVGTFHGFCWQILKRFFREAGLPVGCRVALPEEINDLVQELWPGETSARRGSFLEKISNIKSRLTSEEPPELVAQYNEFLRLRRWLDFDDLIREVVRLLGSNKEVLARLRLEFLYICVDEYQDINALQHELLKLLVRGGPSGADAAQKVLLTAIGDPNQSIYGFRGSDVRFFENFPQDFAGARILTLSENYRSAVNLLTASSQVIGKNERFDIPPLTAKLYLEGHLTVHEAVTDRAEAEYVVHQIEKLVGGISHFSLDTRRVATDEGGEVSFKDFAVLYRLNGQRFALEEAFRRSGIPYFTSSEQAKVEEWNSEGPVLSPEEDRKSEKVSLLTLHASKGLEFKVVFMVGCEEHLLPLDLAGMVSNPDEERRLFYVGMTRARGRLYLLRAKKRQLYGRFHENGPTRYLLDIEEQLKSYVGPQSRKFRPEKRERQMGMFEEG